MTEQRGEAETTTVSKSSKDPELEADTRVPEGPREGLEKVVTEAGAGDGVVDSLKRVAREVDRTFSGEYEARETEAANERAAEHGEGGGQG